MQSQTLREAAILAQAKKQTTVLCAGTAVVTLMLGFAIGWSTAAHFHTAPEVARIPSTEFFPGDELPMPVIQSVQAELAVE